MTNLFGSSDLAWTNSTDVKPSNESVVCPAPLPSQNTVSQEAQEEFARPHLASGTVVDVPVPNFDWYSEMRPLVARRIAKPSSLLPMMEQKVNAKQPWWKRLLKSR